jgi:hypothetical protein
VIKLQLDPTGLNAAAKSKSSPISPFGNRAGALGIGGAILLQTIDDTTLAAIESSAMIHTGTGAGGGLGLGSTENLVSVNLAQSGGASGIFGLSGAVSIVTHISSTMAKLESGVQIYGGPVGIKSKSDLNDYIIAGAAQIAGGSGASANNDDITAASAEVLPNTNIQAATLADITANNNYTENVPPNGNSVADGGGGVINGNAADSSTNLTGNSSVTIDGNVTMDVETLTPAVAGVSGIFLNASSALSTADLVTLSAGGGVEGGGVNSSLNATRNNGVATSSSAMAPDRFATNQDVGIGTDTQVNADNTSASHTWGVLGAGASAAATADVTANQEAFPSAKGIGHGYELFFIPITNGSSSTSTPSSSNVTINGNVTAGVFHTLNITIPNDQSAGDANGDSRTVIVDGGPARAAASSLAGTLFSGPTFMSLNATFDPNFNRPRRRTWKAFTSRMWPMRWTTAPAASPPSSSLPPTFWAAPAKLLSPSRPVQPRTFSSPARLPAERPRRAWCSWALTPVAE